jgi:HAD superfamily hydrolase (TIGR01662 family)
MVDLNSSLRFPVVLFDLGSTLIYFSGDWPEVIQQGQIALVQTLLQAGLKLDSGAFQTQLQASMNEYFFNRDAELIEHTTGTILRGLLSRWSHTDLPESLLLEALQAMYQVSEAYWQVEAETQSALDDLRRQGYRLGLISNAADDANVQRLVDKAGLRPYFDVILTSAAEGIRKPHPRIFQAALQTWPVHPAQAVMVGDMLSADIVGAYNLGIYSVWVTRRAAPPANPAPSLWPDAIIENVGELPELLSSLA